MTETDRRARIAGAIYLPSLIPGVFSLIYVPGVLIVHGDTPATVARILAHETLFRWGMAGEVAGAVIWTLVIRALYRLLADIDRGQAWLMVALSLMASPIWAMSVVSEMAALTMLHDPEFGAAFSLHQAQALVGVALKANAQAYTIAGVFWGLWLFPFAVLVWKSGFLPRFLAVLLVIGGLGYVASSGVTLVAPSWRHLVSGVTGIATSAGELPIIFWLLIVRAGGRRERAAPQ